MNGELRDEKFNPVGLLKADPTFDVASEEHSDVAASGGTVWFWSSSELGIIGLEACNEETGYVVEFSPSQD